MPKTKLLFDRYNLNLAGEYRVAAELLLRGVFATVTYGNKKGADIFAIGENRRAAVVEVKASQKNRFVTGLYQKYPDPEKPHPDFWVLYSVARRGEVFEEHFFVLTHAELAQIQGKRNCHGEELTYEEYAARVKKGVDNVRVDDVKAFKGAWDKVLEFCNDKL
ncbi:MAG: hypothetical protein KY475_01760 [Planctomycetes bacterium]|nr:hypothetical protein [Planctomycetota bacterium]